MVATPLQVLQGEFFLRTGPKDKGRAMLEEAVKRVRAVPGPDAWTQALFALEAIARAAREAGEWDFAAWGASDTGARSELRGIAPRPRARRRAGDGGEILEPRGLGN